MEKKKDISKEFEESNERISRTFIRGLEITFIVFIISLAFSWLVFGRTRNYEIMTISSNEENTFVLGVGNLGNDEYFVCYTEDKNGSLIIKTFSSENTTICKTLESDEEAYAEITTNFSGTKNKLYVPKDTIQIEYNLGLTE